MACRRCHGLTVVDHFIDMRDDRGHLWLAAWRCVNCGEVAEPGILRNRQTFFAKLMSRQRRPEAIPIGI